MFVLFVGKVFTLLFSSRDLLDFTNYKVTLTDFPVED